MVEVLISGAGPAGVAAATMLARRGARVLLVDRARPASAPGGIVLHRDALARLSAAGLPAENFATAIELDGLRVTGPRADVTLRPRAPWGVAVSRGVFGERLVESAVEAGAQVQLGVETLAPLRDGGAVRGAVLRVGGRQVRVPAMVTVVAEGHASALVESLGLARRRGSGPRVAVAALFTGVEGAGGFAEVHVRPGYHLGLTPLAGGLTDVYVVSPANGFETAPADRLLAHVGRDRLLAARFSGARLVGGARCVRVGAPAPTVAGADGLLLAGDAAGALEPPAFDGVAFAVRGGMLAAKVADAMLEGACLRGHVELTRRRRAEFHRAWRRLRWLHALVTNPAGVVAADVAARRLPSLLRAVTKGVGEVTIARRSR